MRPDERMPLRAHLDELRGTLVRCVVVLVLLFVLGVVLEKFLLDFVWIPWNTTRADLVALGRADPGPLVTIGPAEAMIAALKLAFMFAALVGSPYFLWQMWRFIGVGLNEVERRAVQRAFWPGLLLLLGGMSFGYTILLPFGLEYLVSYLDPSYAIPNVTVTSYVKFVTSLTLLMGLVFELPLLMWAIVRAGLIGAATLRRSRRIAILLMLVFAAVMTPPDAVSMCLVGAPMIVLYEVGLWLARGAERARVRSGGRRIDSSS